MSAIGVYPELEHHLKPSRAYVCNGIRTPSFSLVVVGFVSLICFCRVPGTILFRRNQNRLKDPNSVNVKYTISPLRLGAEREA